MQERVLRGLRRAQTFIDQIWYPPFLGFLCVADLVILIVPLDPLLLSSCILRPRSWWKVSASMIGGAILGAFLVAKVVQYDPTVIQSHFAAAFASPGWHATEEHLRQHGMLGLILCGLSPAPQIFPVLVGALAGIPAIDLALSLGAGRALKYLVYSFLAAHAPDLLRRVPGLKKSMDLLTQPAPEKKIDAPAHSPNK